MPELQLFRRAQSHGAVVALRSAERTTSYAELLDRSAAVAALLLGSAADLGEARVALLAPPGPEYVAGQWGAWRAGGVVLPLCLTATEPEWEYALTDSAAALVLATRETAPRIAPLCQRLGLRLVLGDERPPVPPAPPLALTPERRALILYTSGSTSKPKGVVTTHAQIQAQIESLVAAWEWSAADRIPLFLPLHHIHGVINVLGCALWSGAVATVFPKFDAAEQLARAGAGEYTLFMAVPTIYIKLIAALKAAPPVARDAALAGFRALRLMVSGSAALPASVHEEWFQLTGQKLLERYGMTEIGMALSNPYRGERRPGAVGQPLPGVAVRLVAEQGELVTGEDAPGEIQVRGPGVFREYWNRPELTRDAFAGDWFRTGDVAVREAGYYRILGRQSVDIIKSGGYKLSALEIEAVLLEHPHIAECAVVGLPDPAWGEAVTAVVVLTPGAALALPELRAWCKERLSVYKIPQRLAVVPTLPRNALGKVTKPAVRALAESLADAGPVSPPS